MRYVECDLGVNTADAADVAIRFDGGGLQASFIDWQAQARAVRFGNVLAFRWQDVDEPVPRHDGTFEVVESDWLARQAKLQSVPPDNLSHYLLCFNACGVLEVVAGEVSTK